MLTRAMFEIDSAVWSSFVPAEQYIYGADPTDTPQQQVNIEGKEIVYRRSYYEPYCKQCETNWAQATSIIDFDKHSLRHIILGDSNSIFFEPNLTIHGYINQWGNDQVICEAPVLYKTKGRRTGVTLLQQRGLERIKRKVTLQNATMLAIVSPIFYVNHNPVVRFIAPFRPISPDRRTAEKLMFLLTELPKY